MVREIRIGSVYTQIKIDYQAACNNYPLMSHLALIILGMHRSGTSCITRLANLLGAELTEHLVPAGPDNAQGFFEDARMVAMNEEALEGFRTSHLGRRLLPPQWQEKKPAVALRSQAAELISTDYAQKPFFALKDPRLCRLLPIWQEVLNYHQITHRYIFAFRNPLEVAHSLKRRNKLKVKDGLLLWLLYTVEAERYTRDQHRAFLYYPDVIKDWRVSMVSTARHLNVHWPRTPESIAADAATFIQHDMRHNHAEELHYSREIPTDYLPFLHGVYSSLMSASESNKLDPKSFDLAEEFLEAKLGSRFRLFA